MRERTNEQYYLKQRLLIIVETPYKHLVPYIEIILEHVLLLSLTEISYYFR